MHRIHQRPEMTHLRLCRLALLLALASTLLAAPVTAQQTIVVKKDGTKVEGAIIEEDFDFVVIEIAGGEKVKIMADDIKEVLYPEHNRKDDSEIEGAGGANAGKRPRKGGEGLAHEQEWPREAATPFEEKVWALGPKIRWNLNEEAAKELAALESEEKLALFEELLLFEYSLVPEAEDEIDSLWRTTLAQTLGATRDEKYLALAKTLAADADTRKKHDALILLAVFPSDKNAELIAEIFANSVEEIPASQRPYLGDILIANEEGFNEAIDDLDAAYSEQPGLPSAAEKTLKAMGKTGIEGIVRHFRHLSGEKKRAALYLVARLTEISTAEREKYGYSDDDVEQIKRAATEMILPALGRDDEYLVDIFFSIVKIGETTYGPLIQCLKSQDQKRWAGVALRRMTGTSMPTSYERWSEWYKLKFGK